MCIRRFEHGMFCVEILRHNVSLKSFMPICILMMPNKQAFDQETNLLCDVPHGLVFGPLLLSMYAHVAA